MIRPLPEDSSFAISTLVPGEFSKSSTEGMASPDLTMLAKVVLNLRGSENLWGRTLRVRIRDLSMKL